MDIQSQVNRLAKLGAEEARLTAKVIAQTQRLGEIHAERCVILCLGYKEHAATLGLNAAVDPTVIEPKD